MRLLVTLGAFLFAGIVLATPLHNIVVFGDSLSDNGNLYELMKHQMPPSPPYYEGRFSNGPVWIEYLVASYFPDSPNSHLLDYAYGGAGVSEEEGDDEVLFTLRREVNNYLLTHEDKADADSLFVVWIGANNYLGLPSEIDKAIQDVNDGIRHSLQRLADKGAKYILVVNIPNLGNTPAAVEFDIIDTMTYLSKEHNNTLNKTLANLKQEYPGVTWLHFDMNEAFSQVIANPQEFGLNNVTESCANSVVNEVSKTSVLKMVTAVKSKVKHDACNGYLFFDLVHPTAIAHKLLAERARIILDKAGIEFTD